MKKSNFDISAAVRKAISKGRGNSFHESMETTKEATSNVNVTRDNDENYIDKNLNAIFEKAQQKKHIVVRDLRHQMQKESSIKSIQGLHSKHQSAHNFKEELAEHHIANAKSRTPGHFFESDKENMTSESCLYHHIHDDENSYHSPFFQRNSSKAAFTDCSNILGPQNNLPAPAFPHRRNNSQGKPSSVQFRDSQKQINETNFIRPKQSPLKQPIKRKKANFDSVDPQKLIIFAAILHKSYLRSLRADFKRWRENAMEQNPQKKEEEKEVGGGFVHQESARNQPKCNCTENMVRLKNFFTNLRNFHDTVEVFRRLFQKSMRVGFDQLKSNVSAHKLRDIYHRSIALDSVLKIAKRTQERAITRAFTKWKTMTALFVGENLNSQYIKTLQDMFQSEKEQLIKTAQDIKHDQIRLEQENALLRAQLQKQSEHRFNYSKNQQKKNISQKRIEEYDPSEVQSDCEENKTSSPNMSMGADEILKRQKNLELYNQLRALFEQNYKGFKGATGEISAQEESKRTQPTHNAGHQNNSSIGSRSRKIYALEEEELPPNKIIHPLELNAPSLHHEKANQGSKECDEIQEILRQRYKHSDFNDGKDAHIFKVLKHTLPIIFESSASRILINIPNISPDRRETIKHEIKNILLDVILNLLDKSLLIRNRMQ